MAGKEYHRNHYVPEWYQRSFLLPGQSRYHYLDLNPEVLVQNGHRWTRNDVLHWGPDRCFAQEDLYTTRWGNIENVDIEKFFFGDLDDAGKAAVAAFADYSIRDDTHTAFQTFIRYMSVQRLRTPKGLAWLKATTGTAHQNVTMRLLQFYQKIFCAVWTDSVWQIADASQSPTKFIVSDNPVTVYNRDCFPGSVSCRFPNDPDVRLVGTQTIFPLTLDKLLILTNMAWVRNPYQSATKMGPNDRLMRDTIFNMMDVQTERMLTEEEVVEVNYIIKRRAHRYVAAAEKEWLYPERQLVCEHWRRLGNGYLLMPDPRHVHMGGTVVAGWDNGRSEAWGPYRHRPWENAYEDEDRDHRETETLYRFQAEWSAMFGAKYRGRTHRIGRVEPEAEEWQESYDRALALDAEYRKRPGERQRRRQLMRP